MRGLEPPRGSVAVGRRLSPGGVKWQFSLQIGTETLTIAAFLHEPVSQCLGTDWAHRRPEPLANRRCGRGYALRTRRPPDPLTFDLTVTRDYLAGDDEKLVRGTNEHKPRRRCLVARLQRI
jgi:hypothetical protein